MILAVHISSVNVKDFEPEKKKLICRSLRFIAHLHGATLQYYSAKDPGLVKKVIVMIKYWITRTCSGSGFVVTLSLQLSSCERNVPGLQQATHHPSRFWYFPGLKTLFLSSVSVPPCFTGNSGWRRSSQVGCDEASVQHPLSSGGRGNTDNVRRSSKRSKF